MAFDAQPAIHGKSPLQHLVSKILQVWHQGPYPSGPEMAPIDRFIILLYQYNRPAFRDRSEKRLGKRFHVTNIAILYDKCYLLPEDKHVIIKVGLIDIDSTDQIIMSISK